MFSRFILLIVGFTISSSIAYGAGVCDRTTEVSDTISDQLQKHCDEVTDSDLASIKDLLFWDYPPTTLKAGDFAGLTSLVEISMDDGLLVEYPADIFENLPSLQKLRIWIAQTPNLTSEFLSGLKNLEQLTIYFEDSTSIPEGFFSTLQNLKRLEIFSDSLGGLNPHMLDNNKGVTTLSVGVPGVTQLPEGFLDNMPALEEIDFRGSKITSYHQGVFKNNPALKFIMLRNTRLSSLPEGVFDNLKNLERLYIDRNNFTTPLSPTLIKNNVLLRAFAMDWGPTSEEILKSVPQLQSLQLRVPRMDMIPVNFLSIFPQLDYVFFSLTQSTESDSISEDFLQGAAKLTFFGLSGARFASKTMPENLINRTPTLGQVWFKDDNLTHLPANFFKGLFQSSGSVIIHENSFSYEEQQKILASVPPHVKVYFDLLNKAK